jgi:glycosyltransferase involved in cell wall biosynthesis
MNYYDPCPETMPDGSAWPRISVVTPSYNQAQYVEGTLRSVLGQNYPNLEYIVIDAASTDGSTDIIGRYADKLHYYVSEPDRGHGHGLNKGFERSTGEIMAWLNSDDMYHPWTFRVVAEIFTQFPEVNWIVGTNAWWSERGALLTANRGCMNIYDYLMGRYQWVQQESVFWRRPLWERAGGKIDERYSQQIDAALWGKFFLTDRLYMVDCILSGVRMHRTKRSILFNADVHTDIANILGELREQCSPVQRARARQLEFVRRLRKSRLRHLPVERIARRVFRDAFRDAQYPVIRYDFNASTWTLTSFRYRPESG